MNNGHLDFETYSELDVRKVGAYRYARHPSTEVLIARYLLPGMTFPALWLPLLQKPPKDLVAWVEGGGRLGAHNASFERCVWHYVLRKRFGSAIPLVPDKQWFCTAAKAAASGLPRSLDKALAALELPVRKDPEGTRLIKKFSNPRKPTKKDPRTRIFPEDDPEDFRRFIAYCGTDVMGEVALDEALPDLNSREQVFFRLDMRMNDRGIPLDMPLVHKALVVVKQLEIRVAEKITAMTGGIKGTQVAKMLEHFSELGLDLENMRAETIRQALKNTKLSPETRELLEWRIEAGKASTKKLASMVLCADPHDHVVQGTFLIYGAHTGRYAARLVQPHNFIRGSLKEYQRDLVFDLLENGDVDLFTILYEKPIDTISQCMRGFIMAPDGYELAVVDYTAIEARILAWLCDEKGMLEAYFRGVDVYKLMAVKLFKLKSLDDVTDEQRRISKNLVLGCGYQLGGVKFVEYCANAGLIIDPDFAMLAVKAYRADVPNIVKSWKTVEALCVEAIRNPGTVTRGLHCKFYMREHWLCIQLPSGREIRYPYARATLTERWGKPAYQISFRTEIKGRFVRETTYGGKLIENIVQAIARDVMMEGMYNAETNGYPVIGTVHDELLTLRKRGTSDVKELERIVCPVLPWTKDMPLAAKGFITIRYKKD